MRGVGILFGTVVVLLACAENTKGGDLNAACEEAREHTAELSLVRTFKPRSEREERHFLRHSQQLQASLGEHYLEDCRRRGPRYAQCTLNAENRATLVECTERFGGSR